MTLEDYGKYYIQGSDHYLIPTDDFTELVEENNELKKQLETYEIEGYEQNEELNKMSFDIRKYKLQQKEFIKWLEDKIKFSVKPTSRVLLKSILANYKEITGVSDENN